ncbi:MAG TPA: hypothetical protein VMB18_14150 [Terriglobales bacterium]|nr:hypothetical protein [Terriglobales bacterium]HUK49036.1 hypothetical protein [Terriglobales bacterium]
MKTLKRTLAAAELVLIFPAGLFMTALFVRNVQPEQYQPAHAAAQIVTWYAKGPVWLTLWTLMMALPFAVLVIGGATLVRNWRRDAELRRAAWEMLSLIRGNLATLVIAVATLASAGILGIVALHALTD